MLTRFWHRPGTRDHRAPHRRSRDGLSRRLSLEPLEDRSLMAGNVVLDWNHAVLGAITATATGPNPASRSLAIVHAAVYDAVNAVDRTHAPYLVDVTAAPGTSREAAAAAAAYRASITLFPTQTARFDAVLARSLDGIPVGRPLIDGIVLGDSVATTILDRRSTDGSDRVVVYTPGTGPGDWQPTPPAFAAPVAPQWGGVTPFAIPRGDLYRPEGPPALTSREYTAAFNEVRELGAVNSTVRSAEGTEIARFWASRVTPGAAAGQWNQITARLSEAQGLTLSENARLFALLNLATADASIACWDAKYTYDFWRPVTAIREADGDGNPDTLAEADWTPLIPTPAHPAYTSGHSTIAAAATTALAGYFGTDTFSFTALSDDLPGVVRSYTSFSAASNEGGRSRILGGIHWSFDNFDGRAAGRSVGEYVVANFLRPVGGPAVEPPAAAEGGADDPATPDAAPEPGRPVKLAAALPFGGADLGGDRLGDLFRLDVDGDGGRGADERDDPPLPGKSGRPARDPEFLGIFDSGGDGDVGGLDRDEFLRRLGTRLDPS